MIPPRPEGRRGRGWIGWLAAFRRDLLSAQPEHLFAAKMAEFRAPGLRSFLVLEPDLVARVLKREPDRFPKSRRVTKGLASLLGASVFVTEGAVHARQRRLIDPAFAGGRLRDAFPAMLEAARAASAKLSPGEVDLEPVLSRATADVMFRALFSVPITEEVAARTFDAFRAFQRAQPVLTPAALHPALPAWQRPATTRHARALRRLIRDMVDRRAAQIDAGNAPDDLATRIMTARDPDTGHTFTPDEMTDQVAIFFLAGHETSAAALSWALWCLAAAPDQAVLDEARAFAAAPSFETLDAMPATRVAFRETLRLYPPVPMFVREAAAPTTFRDRAVRAGDQVVISPWHMGRHAALWEDAHSFRPSREQKAEGMLAFGAGPRACPGAGFAMTEALVLIAVLLADWRMEPTRTRPVPVAHLTLRARDGIKVQLTPRD